MAADTVNHKRIAKNTVMLYFRTFLTMGISIYTSRVVLEVLGINDYGIYNVIGGFVSMFVILSGAMTSATQRFLSFEIGKGKAGAVREIFSTSVQVHILLAIIIFIIAETIGLWFVNSEMNIASDRMYAANWVYQISVFTFLVNICSVPYNAAIVAYEKMSAFAYISIIEVTLKLLVVYLLIIFPSVDRLILYAIFLAAIAVIVRIIYSIYCINSFEDCHNNWKFNKGQCKRIMSFVSWNLIGSASQTAKEHGINVLLNIFFGTAINASRGIAYQVYNALVVFVNNFQMAMNPQIIKTYAAENKEAMLKLVFRGSKFSYIIMFMLSLPLIIEAPYILSIWLKVVPPDTAIFMRIVLLMAMVNSLSGALITSMHASGKVRNYQIVVGGVSLMTLPFAYILLKLGMAPYWAMIASLLVEIICYFLRIIMLRQIIEFPVWMYLHNVTLKVAILTILAAIPPAVIYIILPINFFSFITTGFVSVISVSAFCYLICLNKEERLFVKEKLNKVLLKIK